MKIRDRGCSRDTILKPPLVIMSSIFQEFTQDLFCARIQNITKKENHSMMKQTIRIIAVLYVILLLQSGCTTIRFSPEANERSPVTKELIKTTQSWDGKLLPGYPQGQPEITILRISIPAGARLHTHHHPVINAGVLLSGQLMVVTRDGKTLHLKAGDPIVEVVNTVHYGFNEGTVPAEIMVFYVGVAGRPITVVEAY
jgi:quercetin dioxygenase-like cupin family protein